MRKNGKNLSRNKWIIKCNIETLFTKIFTKYKGYNEKCISFFCTNYMWIFDGMIKKKTSYEMILKKLRFIYKIDALL